MTLLCKSFKALEVAVGELAKHGLKVESYQINIEALNNSIFVSFADPNRSHGQRGSGTSLIGFEVEVDAQKLNVIRSNFSK
jgi:cell fate regulator YaaT (PSP1 superfamily)